MRVLAIGAHPDDVEHLCAGTLALYAAEGADITIAIATRGDIGSRTGICDSIALLRRQEAEASAALIGARVIWMGFDDELLLNDRPTLLAFVDAIREARPDVMFLLSERDYHRDHRIAGTYSAGTREFPPPSRSWRRGSQTVHRSPGRLRDGHDRRHVLRARCLH